MNRLLLVCLAVPAIACADNSATQYVGSVMHESAPEAEGSLRLTLYSRDDSAFSGVIELGTPARGTGTAYAWHEGSELRVATVSATTGDTIIWSSPLTDDGLGGRYEVTGGERIGDQGTWRARLVKGPPATPATLRSPTPPPLLPLADGWPIALVLAAGVGLARWIRRVPWIPAADETRRPALPWRVQGIAGWLLFFAIGQSFALLVGLARASSAWDDYVGSLGLGAAVAGLRPLVALETVMQFLTVPVTLGGLVLLARRSRYAPRYWFGYLAASGVYLLGDLLAAPMVEAQMVRLFGAEAMNGPGAFGSASQLWQQLAFTVAWAAYWARSERVRGTFGAAALDRTATAAPVPVTEPAPAAELARKGRRGWRMALRIAGGAVVVLLLLLAVGLWSTRSSPYSVPEGADVRATVAGRWTWASDTSGCASAHTIAFADDSRVMTITSADIAASDPVTTYDVRSVSQSTVRGAIRGETRTTNDGVPVVWELVLTGPDEYRWRRTDWASTPWSYTASVHRCPARPAAAAATR